MTTSEEDNDISKTAAKRKFLLTDEDLEVVPFKLKPNPMNKGYAPMKVYDKSRLEEIAIEKHGSMEEIKAKQDEKSRATNSRMENKDEETRKLWDCEELYEPMKQFMVDIDLPIQKTSQYFGRKQACHNIESGGSKQILIEAVDDILNNDIIIHYFDCMHNRAKGAGAHAVHQKFPKTAKLDHETPFNDRKKLGHFCWHITESSQLVIILYVIHKFPKLAPNRPVIPVMNYDALNLGLQRLSKLLEKKLLEANRLTSSLSVGTYLPYKADLEKFTEAYDKAFTIPVYLHTRFGKA